MPRNTYDRQAPRSSQVRPNWRRLSKTAAGVLVATACLLASTGLANAATVGIVDGTIMFTAAPNEGNRVVVTYQSAFASRFTDGGAALTAGNGCVSVSANVVDCADDLSDPVPMTVRLGNKSDSLGMDDCCDPRVIHVSASSGNDHVTIASTDGADVTVDGGAHDDVIRTFLNDSRSSTLRGGEGRDVLVIGEGGRAFLFGGPNNDQLIYTRGVSLPDRDEDVAEYLQAHGGAGRDSIYPAEHAWIEETVSGESGRDTLVLPSSDHSVFDLALCAACGIEQVVGTSGPDVIYGDDKPNWIYGGGGDDTIDPRGGTDYVYAGDGDDTVFSRDGVWDTIRCGAGLLDVATVDRRESVGECETVHRG